MKALVGAFNQEKALVGAFSVITNIRMELFEALVLALHHHEGDLGVPGPEVGQPQLGPGLQGAEAGPEAADVGVDLRHLPHHLLHPVNSVHQQRLARVQLQQKYFYTGSYLVDKSV